MFTVPNKFYIRASQHQEKLQYHELPELDQLATNSIIIQT